MPDPPPPKRRQVQNCESQGDLQSDATNGHATTSSKTTHTSVRYAELHCRTNFSFLEAASHPDELIGRAAELGYEALAVTDRNSLAGVVQAHTAAKSAGLKLLVGAEVTPVDAAPVILLATNRAAYGRLSKLITCGRRAAPKGECCLTFDDVAEHAEGLLACVVTRFDCREAVSGTALAAGRSRTKEPAASALRLTQYRDVFGDRCYALAELHRGPNDRWLLQQMLQAARQANIPLVAANDVHYHEPDQRYLHDVLTAIRHGCPVAELGDRMFPNGERYLKSPRQMRELFADYPDAVARTAEIAGRCNFSLDELRYEYPEELRPPEMTAFEHLTRLTWDGARWRYPQGIPDKVRGLIEHELKLIEELRYEAYFLTVWDLVRFARSRDILCQGRGSAANSVVCFCLEVTSVDPDRIDVLFERFISKERNEAPDIDVDFEHERREEVLQYIYEKYGRDRAGMTAEVITYRPRSAVRDVGKALGLSLDRVDLLAKSLENYSEDDKLASRFREAGLDPTSRLGRQLITLVRRILGFPRHLSQHVGGMVITRGPLCELVPIENAAMPGRTVIEWDKNDLDALGILKVDCLSLGMLTAIRKCFDLVNGGASEKGSGPISAQPGTDRRLVAGRSGKLDLTPFLTLPFLTLASVPPEDSAVYDMVSRADTMGIFQIESRAQMAMLPRLRPKCFYDLVIEVAIVRPGPIQGDMVHPYLRRRAGEEPVEFPDDRIRAVLQKTLGVPIFQEQAMRLAVVAAGFTPGEADQLRRAMGAWRRRGVIDKFHRKLIDGMTSNGYSADFAERVFRQIRGFGEYGFPESHAASFALLVYVSAWLKCYFPAEFTAALLNSQPMGFYAPAQLVADARKRGVEVLPVDVNSSEWDCVLQKKGSGPICAQPGTDRRLVAGRSGKLDLTPFFAIRLGLRSISGLSRTHADVIVERRGRGPFESFDAFVQRTRLSKPVLTKLSKADAFRSLGVNRRTALWHSLQEQKTLPLFESSHHAPRDEADGYVELPPMSAQQEVVADYQSVGLSLRDHPVKFIRRILERMQAVSASQLGVLETGRRYKVGGLVLLRQRPSTASGITFVTLEDETGIANLIIRPEIWERYHTIARRSQAILAHGHLQRQHEVIHLLVFRLEDLSALLSDVNSKSRDFR